MRLTGSGTRLPDLAAVHQRGSSWRPPELAGHGVIEFGNRLLTFALTAVAIATVVVVWRFRPAGPAASSRC